MEQQMNHKSMIEAHKKGPIHEFDIVGSLSSSSSSSVSDISSGSSLESDSFEELEADPLTDMTSLLQQLPIKRGLSKFYQGKSQSFTSLANVRSLEDLAKPENPYNKKLKSCKSYGGGLAENYGAKCHMLRHASSKRGMHSTGSRGSCSALSVRRSSTNFMGNRPPIPPHRSTSTTTIPNQTALFA
ncbi:hypothetical protein SESBI_47010 [Sesbania bispinosa]|nr:hypothetical protein SESBI_47010 [Sesbania bispinosa]